MAEPAEIIEEIERLAIHCRPPLMSVEDQARWKMDWITDLKEFPVEAIRQACHRWRNGTDRKFPLPGQLRPLVVMCNPGQSGGVKLDAWRPLSDGEYGQLTLREKIRHHLILASEALNKAGPMWRHGRPLAEADMPDAWRLWKRRADDHYAEAARLRKHLKHEEAA